MAQSTTKVQGKFYPFQEEWLRANQELMQSSEFEIACTFEEVQ